MYINVYCMPYACQLISDFFSKLAFSKFLINIQNLECLKHHAIHEVLTVRHQQGSLPIQNKGLLILVFLLRGQPIKTKTNIISIFHVKWKPSKLLLRILYILNLHEWILLIATIQIASYPTTKII